MSFTISIIGAGKVGYALGEAFFNAGVTIEHIISRRAESAKELAGRVGADWSNDLSMLLTSRIIIISVPDRSLRDVAGKINPGKDSIVVHTAGSYGAEIFDNQSVKGCGVLYPLQTFTIGRVNEIKSVPFLIEGDSAESADVIKGVAEMISDTVFEVDAEKRRVIHLAAVFVSNFVNHLYATGEKLAMEANLEFSILEPLIRETLSKAMDIGPRKAQTGPALRNDTPTIELHMDLLSFYPELRTIYESITKSILKNSLTGQYE